MNGMFGAMLVLFFASAAWGTVLTATGEPVAAGTEIRDLRGPFPPQGLPPFALTLLGAVAVGGATLTWTRLHGRHHPLTPIDPEQKPVWDAVALLDQLVEAYWRRSCSAGEYCLNLAQAVVTEPARAERFGIRHYCWIGLNSKEAENLRLAEEVLALLPEFLDRPNVLGIGEVGLNKNSRNEIKVLEWQFTLAQRRNELSPLPPGGCMDRGEGEAATCTAFY